MRCRTQRATGALQFSGEVPTDFAGFNVFAGSHVSSVTRILPGAMNSSATRSESITGVELQELRDGIFDRLIGSLVGRIREFGSEMSSIVYQRSLRVTPEVLPPPV